jgi:hypothetical protein
MALYLTYSVRSWAQVLAQLNVSLFLQMSDRYFFLILLQVSRLTEAGWSVGTAFAVRVKKTAMSAVIAWAFMIDMRRMK